MSDIHLFPIEVSTTNTKHNEIPKGINMIEAPRMWDIGYKGRGVVVAVLDTGCEYNHPDLQGQVIDGRNFTSDYNGNPEIFLDNHYHGTHVSGTIAAGLNGFGVAGVAPEASLLILKVIRGNGTSTYESLIEGIEYAIDWRGRDGEQVRVISLSLGGGINDPRLHSAIKRAVAQGILVVCSAGNLGDGKRYTFKKTYPAYYPEVVCVGAVSEDKKPADFTNTNDEIDLVAPGVNIVSTYTNNKYAELSGTSMATPHVSGAAALLIEGYESKLKRTLSEAEIYRLLMNNTEKLGFNRKSVGAGLLNISKGITKKRT
ncbi:S8 family peptidase [Alkalihalobacillus sp. AL-G]|uniref:S8 family peptidase n=1 Tax=Alkalihalobacillus sp. AL-G TaxID=2926399 RepID=UPI00272D7667|nr:S8 family peptidase [Alkalihalobacillus sp. AL-G]WLD91565.1 S8 family peptidase [Alkalihalobacillus sp. AL-G]